MKRGLKRAFLKKKYPAPGLSCPHDRFFPSREGFQFSLLLLLLLDQLLCLLLWDILLVGTGLQTLIPSSLLSSTLGDFGIFRYCSIFCSFSASEWSAFWCRLCFRARFQKVLFGTTGPAERTLSFNHNIDLMASTDQGIRGYMKLFLVNVTIISTPPVAMLILLLMDETSATSPHFEKEKAQVVPSYI